MLPENSDMLDLSETSQDLDIDFDIADLSFGFSDVTSIAGFQYPAMVLSGVVFQDTLRVLQTRARESYRAFDVWLDMEDGNQPVKIGTLPLELETLLVMRYLGVRCTVYFSEDNFELLDLSDTAVLEKYL